MQVFDILGLSWTASRSPSIFYAVQEIAGLSGTRMWRQIPSHLKWGRCFLQPKSAARVLKLWGPKLPEADPAVSQNALHASVHLHPKSGNVFIALFNSLQQVVGSSFMEVCNW
jgi:hypothetical protein